MELPTESQGDYCQVQTVTTRRKSKKIGDFYGTEKKQSGTEKGDLENKSEQEFGQEYILNSFIFLICENIYCQLLC